MFRNTKMPLCARKTGSRNGVRLAQAALFFTPLLLLARVPPPSGVTGAPGEGTCSSCHDGGTGTGSVTITFAGGNTYTPGTTKSVTVTATRTNATTYGFEATAKNASNAAAGTFTAGSGSTTIGSARAYVGESSRSSTGIWTFTWTPPAAGTGTVTFYAAAVAGRGSTGSDSVFTTSATLTEAAGGGGNNTLTISPSALTFNSAGGAVPPTQTIQVTSSGAPMPFTTTVTPAAGWLSAMPPGANTPQAVTVSVNPAGLATGTYIGSVAIAAIGATNSPQSVAVTLNVSAGGTTPTLVLAPAAMTFNSVNGGPAPAQNLQVSSTVMQLSFTAVPSSSGNWLSVSQGSGATPGTISVSVNPTGLTPSTYLGSIAISAPGASNTPQALPVTLIVSAVQPPPTSTPALTYRFHVRDRQSSGKDRLLLDGQGAVDSAGQLTGSGTFTRTSGGDDEDGTVATGSWTATSVMSFSAAASGGGGGGDHDGEGDDDAIRPQESEHRRSSGGVLTIRVQVATMGAGTQSGTMRIASTGSDSGVTLTLDDGTSFVPSRTGNVSITTSGSGSSGGDGHDDDDEGDGDDDVIHQNR